MKKLVILFFCLFLYSCSARQVVSVYEGSTAQRLITYSINRSVEDFPVRALRLMRGEKVYIELNYLEGMTGHTYLRHRIVAELNNKGIDVVEDKSKATMIMDVFCTSLGTDNSYSGVNTPAIPTIFGTLPTIKLFGVDLYRGITQFYFFLYNKSGTVKMKSKIVKGEAKSDEYNLFFFTLHVSSFYSSRHIPSSTRRNR